MAIIDNAADASDLTATERSNGAKAKKLNPMAKEFVPPSLLVNGNAFAMYSGISRIGGKRMTIGRGQGKRRLNAKMSKAQREEVIRRTVYVSQVDQQVTEEELAALFIDCGQIVDCRVCGDPNSVLRFAFIEFTDEEGAKAALDLSGTMLGFCPVKVLPSKTAIAPVDPKLLPTAESAIAALNCSGSILGSLPVRISPSKTPVRPRSPCPQVQ